MSENMLTQRRFCVHAPTSELTSAALFGGFISLMALMLRSLRTAPPLASMLKPQNLFTNNPINVFHGAR